MIVALEFNSESRDGSSSSPSSSRSRSQCSSGRTMSEKSRPIPGYHGYVATREGRIRSHKRAGTFTELNRSGHLRVRLYGSSLPLRTAGGTNGNGAKKEARFADVYVHVLVCLAWHGEPPFEGALVLHLDDSPTNNHPENLRWGTHQENVDHREMDPTEQLAAAEVKWDEWRAENPNPVDSDGFDWSKGDFQ